MSKSNCDSGVFQFIETGVLTDGELALVLASKVPADERTGAVPTYRFDLRIGERVIGGIRFRAGVSQDIELYAGNIGYNVDEAFRGRRFAERACRLLMPLARRHSFNSLWITCDPDNHASRITCERLGAVLVGTVIIPESLDMYQDGEREKCRYWLNVNSSSRPR